MCGIVGILGTEPVALSLVEALKRLEYRGYDSAGIATVEGGPLDRRRAEGKLRNLEARLGQEPLTGLAGIGHTRWATHGRPNEQNAHPHATERVAAVHNGIIENFAELKAELRGRGVHFETDTDTEVVVQLVSEALKEGSSPREAVRHTLGRLEGAFALAFLFAREDDLLIAARRGSPLAIGHGRGEVYLGSDAIALAPFTNTITYLEDGDWAVLTRSEVQIFDAVDRPVKRPKQKSVASALMIDKGNYRHFMAKEIAEQPEVVSHTLAHYLDMGERRARPAAGVDFAALPRLTISACGTAYHAGLVGRYWFEQVARLPVDIDIASEFRYREAPVDPTGLALFISQSGETADTLAAMRYCAGAGQKTAALVNVRESTIAREAAVAWPTLAGPEISVASTKATTCQLAALAALAVAAGRARGAVTPEREAELVGALIEVPRHMSTATKVDRQIEAIAKELAKAGHVFYLGRGTSYPLALEGALKLKEISYIHAEGYAAGELKHGPIALIDETVPVVVIAPHDGLFEKTASNLQEVVARGGRVILITDEAGAAIAGDMAEHVIVMPTVAPFVAPLVYAVPVQLLAYHTAVFMGTDVDQPRNLAKSVTVE